MNGKEKYFVKNTLILFLGKFCTQFISLLLLPLYTRYLLSADYGLVDLIQSYILLFVPVLILRLDSAVFRFLIDKRKDKTGIKEIISNTFITLFVELVVFSLFYCIIVQFVEISYFLIVGFNIAVLMISNVILQITRGIGDNKNYSVASIIAGAFNLLINVILIVIFDFGASSILISSIISNFIAIVYLFFVDKLYRYIELSYINIKLIKQMLIYSLPMIPNALSWWIVSVSDRTIISIIIGVAANGIYSISCKFSNLLNSIFSIFNMSWQETASLHIKSEDRDEFFSKIVNDVLGLFCSLSIMILCFLPVFYDILVGKEFIDSYVYIPILLFANNFNVFIGLVGGIYVALKKTKEIANTTIASAVINLIVNILLIKYIGLYAACLSTLVAYFVLALYRYFDIKKYVNVVIDKKQVSVYVIIFTLSSLAYYVNNFAINILNLLLSSTLILLLNYNWLLFVFSNLKNFKHR